MFEYALRSRKLLDVIDRASLQRSEAMSAFVVALGVRADIGESRETTLLTHRCIRLTRITEYREGFLCQSALILATRITLPHFSVSSAINLPKSAGVIGIGAAPRSASCVFIFGSASPALICWLSRSITSTGVFLGALKPLQPLASKPGMNSPTVGM